MILRYLRLYLGLYLGWGVETLQGRAVSQVKVTGSLEEVELVTDLLQQKYELKRSDCEFEAGIHLIKLKKIQRQFAFVVPRGYVNESPSGVPVFMWFHGLYQTPWFSINALGLPDMLERYGWFGILPFGTEAFKNSSMGGPLQCCSEFCESEKCCLNSKEITSKERACGFWPKKLDLNLDMVDAIFDWMKSQSCIDTSKVFAGGFSFGGTFIQDLACFRSWQFQGFSTDGAPFGHGLVLPVVGGISERSCDDAVPTTYISFCGTSDSIKCVIDGDLVAGTTAKQSRCEDHEFHRKSATVNCTVWTGCYDGHVVEHCLVHAMDHDVPGHIAPDDTSFLHPGSDLDYTKYIFEKFSLRVRNDQLRFYGHPTQEEEEWKQSTWPLQKQHDHMYLRRALASQGMQTLPHQEVSITSIVEIG